MAVQSAPHIIIVEDDPKIAQLLKRFLSSEGYEITLIDNGEEAVQEIVSQQPNLAILDMLLPGIDGIEVCQRIRPNFTNAVLMLTAQRGELNEATALNSGIDDFISKPIRPQVLLARINALLRRVQPKNVDVIQVQDLVIDNARRQVTQSGVALDIVDSEFELLWTLASRAGEVISRDTLFELILGKPYDGLDRSVDMRVSKLRKKLDSNSEDHRYIRTLRNRGYLFVKEQEQ